MAAYRRVYDSRHLHGIVWLVGLVVGEKKSDVKRFEHVVSGGNHVYCVVRARLHARCSSAEVNHNNINDNNSQYHIRDDNAVITNSYKGLFIAHQQKPTQLQPRCANSKFQLTARMNSRAATGSTCSRQFQQWWFHGGD